MIYLTGDVHTEMPKYWEQKIAGSDIDNAVKYLKILKKYNLSCTLFINGICLKKSPLKVKEMLTYNAEIGGHTYNNFGSMSAIKSYIFRKIWGCIYGPKIYQEYDIKKTKKEFERFGLKMLSWRTHSFGSNDNTFKILKRYGVKYVSDLLGDIRPLEKEGIIHMPINIPVDVVSIAYGIWKPESRDSFASCTKGRILPEEWFEILKKRVSYNEKRGIDSILLIHPTTIAVIDDFKLFEEVAKFLSRYKSAKMSEFELR